MGNLLRCYRNSASVIYFSFSKLPTPSSSAPCSPLILKHCKRVCPKIYILTHPHYLIIIRKSELLYKLPDIFIIWIVIEIFLKEFFSFGIFFL